MKGIVFTEFLEMVESKYSADVVDEILDDGTLPSGGIYTSVGTYDHGEMISLLSALGRHTGLGNQELRRVLFQSSFASSVNISSAASRDSTRNSSAPRTMR